MKYFLVVLIFLTMSCIGFAKDTKHKNNLPKRSVATGYFGSSKGEFNTVLSNSIFDKYSEYTIDSIRQGEIGESQAYFVRIVKPFSTTDEGVCIVFIGTSDIQTQPHACTAGE